MVKFNLFCWFYNKARIWEPTLWNKTDMNTESSFDFCWRGEIISFLKASLSQCSVVKECWKSEDLFKILGKVFFASLLSTNNHWALGKNVKRIENVEYQDSWGRYNDRGKRILQSFALWTDFVCWNLSGNQTVNDLYYAALSWAPFDLNGARLEYFIDGAVTHLTSGILFPFFISQQ